MRETSTGEVLIYIYKMQKGSGDGSEEGHKEPRDVGR